MVYDNKCQNRSITNLQNKLRANLQLEETFLKPLVLINCSLLTLRATFTSGFFTGFTRDERFNVKVALKVKREQFRKVSPSCKFALNLFYRFVIDLF